MVTARIESKNGDWGPYRMKRIPNIGETIGTRSLGGLGGFRQVVVVGTCELPGEVAIVTVADVQEVVMLEAQRVPEVSTC